MYGTNVIDDGSTPTTDIVEHLEHTWNFHFIFFCYQ